MNSILKQDLDNFENILEKTKQQGIDFLNDIENIPTSNTYTINPKTALNELGLGSIEALREFNERLAPLMVSSPGPRYWGFVTGGSTPASIVGDWLASIYDQNTQAVKAQGGASALIEFETINLLSAAVRSSGHIFRRICDRRYHVKLYISWCCQTMVW